MCNFREGLAVPIPTLPESLNIVNFVDNEVTGSERDEDEKDDNEEEEIDEDEDEQYVLGDILEELD